MFYEIEIEVGHEAKGHSLQTTGYIRKFKILFKKELIEYAKNETDSSLINQLNHFFKECQFDFLQAYRKYGVVFHGTAKIKNRITGKSKTVYHIEWEKDHWNLELHQFVNDKLEI